MSGGVECGEADTKVGGNPAHYEVGYPFVEEHVEEWGVGRVSVIPETTVTVHAFLHS